MFPGQGLVPTSVDRDEIAHVLPELLVACEAGLGCDPFALRAWPTSVAQPLIYLASLARWSARETSGDVDCLVGHSLGELTALAAGGALDPLEGLHLVMRRGELTERAAALASAPTGMLAMGCDAATARLIGEISGTVVANDNAPTQVVLAGEASSLEQAADLARERRVSCRPLAVSAAFHSPWMDPAVEPFADALRRCTFAPPQLPVISCITCKPIEDPRTELSAALVAPVRWRELVLTLAARGVAQFEEVGPGAVLSKLVRRTVGLRAPAPAPEA